MKDVTIQYVDPAEICECNPEWSSVPSSEEAGGCRCSVISPDEINSVPDKK